MFSRSSKPSKGSSRPSPSSTSQRPSKPSKPTGSAASSAHAQYLKDNGVRIEPRGVYLVLFRLDAKGTQFHWGIVIGKTDRSGLFFHQTKVESWRLEIREKDLSRSLSLLTVLKIGAVESTAPNWIGFIKQVIDETKPQGQFTCRTWALRAVYDLAEAGVLGLPVDWQCIRDIEFEARTLAEEAFSRRINVVRRSDKSRA